MNTFFYLPTYMSKTDIFKVIDIDRGFNKVLSSFDKEVSYINDIESMNTMFELIAEYAIKTESFVNNTRLVPSSKIDSLNKMKLMKKYLEIEELQSNDVDRIFDLYDYYITILTKVLLKIDEGFVVLNKSKIFKQPISFNITMESNLHLLFYMLFYHTFPKELLETIKNKFKITNIEDRMIEKCNNTIISKHNKICNMYEIEKKDSKFKAIENLFDISLQSEVPLDTQYGILILLKTFAELKNPSKDRKETKIEKYDREQYERLQLQKEQAEKMERETEEKRKAKEEAEDAKEIAEMEKYKKWVLQRDEESKGLEKKDTVLKKKNTMLKKGATILRSNTITRL